MNIDYSKLITKEQKDAKAQALIIEDKNSIILAEIVMEEAKQARAIREHILGDTTAINRIKIIDDNIKAARLKLVK